MSARARHRRTNGGASVGKKIGIGLCVLLGILVAAGAVGAGWVYNVMADAPSIDDLKPLDSGENSVVYDSTGERLGFIDADIVRERVELDEIPKSIQNATIAIEDENFYEHNDIDLDANVHTAGEN